MMGPTKELRIGVVGFGYWGPNQARSVSKADHAKLVAVCDANEQNLIKARAAHPGVATFASVDEMLTGIELDAVIVATSVPTHFDLAAKVIAAGKDCLVEKPLTLRLEEAEELVRRANEAEVMLMVGHLMIYHSAVQEVRRIIQSGVLGEVRYLYAQRLNLGKIRTAENAFWSLAAHDVSIALYLLGETPSSVSANGAAFVTEGIQDVVFANLCFPSGKMANIHVSWLDPHKVRKFTIVGTEKMLVFDDMDPDNKIWIFDKGVGPAEEAPAYGDSLAVRYGSIEVPYVKMREPLLDEVNHFVDCCLYGRPSITSGQAGLDVVRVLTAVDQSMAHQGTPVVCCDLG